MPDGRTLAIQRQTRDQKQLDLLFADTTTGVSRVILSEYSESWIDLHHELTFLTRRPEFIWASSRSGFTHLYLYDCNGTLIRPLTRGEWNVDNFRSRAIHGVDEAERMAYFTSTEKSPLERHLSKVHLDTGEISQITEEAGVHAVSMAPGATYFVDHSTAIRSRHASGCMRRTASFCSGCLRTR